jgi:nitrate reductase beta subunit
MAECFLNHVFLCYLPAHCPHGLQPLNNSPFNVLKAAYRKEVEKLAVLIDSTPVDQINFIRACASARRVAFTPNNIMAGWRVTGNW